MPAPVITLTTDFGDSSYYVGTLRGVLLSECPEARIVDITHHVAPFSALDASFVLAQACPHFPAGTIHLAVIDPGVGGLRMPLIVATERYYFVGPDNGLFTPFFDGTERVFRIRGREGAKVGSTFHGRDIFAPTAGKLARGERPEDLGELTAGAVRLHAPHPRREGAGVVGQILLSDHFGNLITNIHERDLDPLGAGFDIWVGSVRLAGLARTYQDGVVGEPVALIGSSGYLELAVVQGSAGAQLGVGRGERVRVTPRPAP